MPAKIALILLCAAVMIMTPFYVKAQRGGAGVKSLAIKMTAACGYIAAAFLAIEISGEFSAFDKIMLCALAFSWIGDLFLHLWQKKIFTPIGFTGFLTAHFFFIAAYLKGISLLQPERGFFSLPEIALVAVFDIFFVIFSIKIGTNLKGLLKIPILLYATVITTMLCKAAVLGISAVQAGIAQAPAALICAVSGAALFVMSDFSIAILMFNEKHKKNYPLKMFNMLTYYAAQLLLACLIIFI